MRKFDNINVIPFIDILLVLLAIVLTTATFVSRGQLDIALPVASHESDKAIVPDIEIAIDREANVYYNGKPATHDQIRAYLLPEPVDTPIVLLVDESVEFHSFVTLIDLLKSLSRDTVSILTRKSG